MAKKSMIELLMGVFLLVQFGIYIFSIKILLDSYWTTGGVGQIFIIMYAMFIVFTVPLIQFVISSLIKHNMGEKITTIMGQYIDPKKGIMKPLGPGQTNMAALSIIFSYLLGFLMLVAPGVGGYEGQPIAGLFILFAIIYYISYSYIS